MADDDEQLDDNEEISPDEEEEGKKGGKKKLIIALAILLLLGGGGAGAYFMGFLDSVLGIEAAEEGEHDDTSEHGEKKEKSDKKKDTHKSEKGEGGSDTSAFLPLPPMIVNLNTEDGAPRFLRLTVQLELEDPDEKDQVEAVIPRVIDQFQTYLRELRVSDLRGSAGVYRLQMELLWRVNQAVEPIEIKDVLFQEILIQ